MVAGGELKPGQGDPEEVKRLEGEGNVYTKNTVRKTYSIDLRNGTVTSNLVAGPSRLEQAKSLFTLGIPEAGQYIGETAGAISVSGDESYSDETRNQADKEIGGAGVGLAIAVGTKRAATKLRNKSSSSKTEVVVEKNDGIGVETKSIDAPNKGVDQRAKGSVRKQDYPTRVRKPVKEKLEKNATDSNGQIRCQNKNCDSKGGKPLRKGEGTVEHEPELVKTHNEKGYDTDQPTRNDLYNDTAKEIHCKGCQSKQGGSTKEKYRRDTGPNYKPRPSRKRKK